MPWSYCGSKPRQSWDLSVTHTSQGPKASQQWVPGMRVPLNRVGPQGRGEVEITQPAMWELDLRKALALGRHGR